MPPYCIGEDALRLVYASIAEAAELKLSNWLPGPV